MRIAAALTGDLEKLLAQESADIAIAVTAGVQKASDGAKEDLRGQVRGAGLGDRMAKTWQNKVYPKGRKSRGAAGLVYSKAPTIIRAFDEGAVIRSKDGFWLAIPTAATPRGKGGKRLTPLEVEKRFGQPLRFIYRAGKPGLLVFDNVRIGRAGTAKTLRRTQGGAEFTPLRGRTSAVMFILVPQARLKKRLDVDMVGKVWIDRLAGLILAAFPADGGARS